MNIFLLHKAVRADGALQGRTRITAVEAETADDEPVETAVAGGGSDIPWIARFGRPAEGVVRGRTLTTKAIETSDDEA